MAEGLEELELILPRNQYYYYQYLLFNSLFISQFFLVRDGPVSMLRQEEGTEKKKFNRLSFPNSYLGTVIWGSTENMLTQPSPRLKTFSSDSKNGD